MSLFRRLAAALGTLGLLVAALVVTSAPAAQAASYTTTSYGQKNANVMTVQYLLNARGISVGTDGSFGNGTKGGVQTFQRSAGLDPDGSVGPLTWPKLVVNTNRDSTNRSAVRAVQTQLNKYGYQLAVDGDFGTRTYNAVRDFQSDRNIGVDGSVGPVTWRELVGYSQSGDQIACWYRHGTTPSTMTSVQIGNVKQIMSAVRSVTSNRDVKIMALMGAMQESAFCNIDSDISDRDSLGMFQQRPSQGWCSPTHGCANAYQATLGFLGRSSYTSNVGLLDINWWNYSKTRAIDRVQRSCCPDAYAKWESLARSLVNTYG